jgi:type IV secretion system protein VirB3
MAGLGRAPVFPVLTRPQMFGGSPFPSSSSTWRHDRGLSGAAQLLGSAAGLVLHGAGYLACLREPRVFDLWLTRVSRCPRVRNWRRWGCNSYAP